MRIIFLANKKIKLNLTLDFKPDKIFYFDEKNWLDVFKIVSKKLSNTKIIIFDTDGFLPFLYFSKQKNACVSYPLSKEIVKLSRQHNDAQIMVIPFNFINKKELIQYIFNFFETEFEGGRHKTRLAIMKKVWKPTTKPTKFTGKRIAIASDHAGYELKRLIIAHLAARKYEIIDVGTYNEKSTHYPIHALALGLNTKQARIGIAICGSGIGIANTINKFKALNCCICSSPTSAKISRQKYGCNVLAMGARFISPFQAIKTVDKFLATKSNQNFQPLNKMGFAYDAKKFSRIKVAKNIFVPKCLK